MNGDTPLDRWSVPQARRHLSLRRGVVLLALLLGAGLSPVRGSSVEPPREPAAAGIRTPPAAPTPRITGPRIYGARPGHPFFYRIPATGRRPLRFSAAGLPAGLRLDPSTGYITGETSAPGSHPVTITATNALGVDHAVLDIVIGRQISLTPPMGWNSWECFGPKVTAADIRAAADTLVSSGLVNHGWVYINVDDGWQGPRDAQGRIQGNAKFGDMKALVAYVHRQGLKFGIYSSPGPRTCAGFTGSYGHEEQDAQTYASWGVDYVKYDWCTYRQVFDRRMIDRYAALLGSRAAAYRPLAVEEMKLEQRGGHRTPEETARLQALEPRVNALLAAIRPARQRAIVLDERIRPYRIMGDCLVRLDRDMVYSLCQYGMADVWKWGAQVHGNLWRTTRDIWNSWGSMCSNGFRQNDLQQFAGPGHWNDPDMLEIGNPGLTPHEEYTQMTLWSMLSAPLLISCDLTRMSPLTDSLLSNDEVLAVDQDAAGRQGYRLKRTGRQEVWVKSLANGSLAVAFFNRGDRPAEIGVTWKELHVTGRAAVRDLWREEDVRPQRNGIGRVVAAHGAELFTVTPRG